VVAVAILSGSTIDAVAISAVVTVAVPDAMQSHWLKAHLRSRPGNSCKYGSESPRPVAVVVRKSEIFGITKELRSFERLCGIFAPLHTARREYWPTETTTACGPPGEASSPEVTLAFAVFDRATARVTATGRPLLSTQTVVCVIGRSLSAGSPSASSGLCHRVRLGGLSHRARSGGLGHRARATDSEETDSGYPSSTPTRSA
jgi:hypothetical protein